MAYTSQTFSVGQILTAAQMNALQTSMDEVRIQHQGTTAPAELATGVMWLDTTTTGAWVLKLRDDAGDWIELFTIDNSGNTASPSGAASGGAYGEQAITNAAATGVEFVGPILALRNLLINGGFDVWQRGTSFTAVADQAVTADRWGWINDGSGVVTISRDASTTPADEAACSFLVDVTTADGALAAGDAYAIVQVIEGQIFKRAQFGKSSARDVTLSFWVRSNKTGTYCVALRNKDRNRCWVAEYSIQASNTWEKKEITITGDTGGTWEYDEDEGALLSFCLGAGTNRHATAESWGTGDDLCTSSQENFLDSTSNDFRLASVQLEVGPGATPFESRTFQAELLMCQRYYWKSFPYATAPAQQAGIPGAWVARLTADLGRGVWVFFPPTEMRITPSWTTYNPTNANANACSVDGNDRVIGTEIGGHIHKSTRGLTVRTPGDDPARAQDNSYLHATLDAEFTIQ